MLYLSLYFSMLQKQRFLKGHCCRRRRRTVSMCNLHKFVIHKNSGDELENSVPTVVTFTPFLTMEPAALSGTGVVRRRWGSSRMLAYVSLGDLTGRRTFSNAWKESTVERRSARERFAATSLRFGVRDYVRDIRETEWMKKTNGGNGKAQRRTPPWIFPWN